MQQHEEGNATVLRAKEHKSRVIPGNAMTYEELSPEGTKSMAMFSVTAAAGQSTGSNALCHGGDENLLVVSGTFELEVEGTKHVLQPGDSIFVPRGKRHRFANVGQTPGKAIFVLSPAEY